MHLEVISISVTLNTETFGKVDLLQTFIAPSYVIKAFAELLDNNDEEWVQIKNTKCQMQDISVAIGDSQKAIDSFICLQRYGLNLQTHSILEEILDSYPKDKRDSTEFITVKNWYSKSLTNKTS